jgi:type VI secretion system protein ImpI
MDILFEIVSRQKFSQDVRVNIVFGEAGGIIGRSDECDWILPDKTKQVSRKHAIITCFNGYFHIEDISRNGIFHSLGRERLPANVPVKISHGDGFILGEYTIMARLMQQAGSYVGDGTDSRELFADKALSLNPVEAMDQEAERTAVERLGNYNDILGRTTPPTLVPSDHSEATTASLPPIVPQHDRSAPVADPWDARGTLDRLGGPGMPAPAAPAEPQPEIVRETVVVPETDLFFALLGYTAPPDAPEERERILRTAALILKAAVEGITQAMQNRAECKNELRLSMTTTSLAVSNNPLKFSPTAESALTVLLDPPRKGIMEPVEAMKEAFRDNHSHHLGLLAGARAAVGSALQKIAPEAVEARLDANGPVRFGRNRRLWSTFIRMHYAQKNDHEGFEALFLQDFARAYEMQCRTLNPAAYRRQKGDGL